MTRRHMEQCIQELGDAVHDADVRIECLERVIVGLFAYIKRTQGWNPNQIEGNLVEFAVGPEDEDTTRLSGITDMARTLGDDVTDMVEG